MNQISNRALPRNAKPSSSRSVQPIGPSGSPTLTVVPLRIMIEPNASGRKWRASLNGNVLCPSASPFILSARVCLSDGRLRHRLYGVTGSACADAISQAVAFR